MIKQKWQPVPAPSAPASSPVEQPRPPADRARSQTLPRAKRGRISVNVDATKPEHVKVREIPSKRHDPRSE